LLFDEDIIFIYYIVFNLAQHGFFNYRPSKETYVGKMYLLFTLRTPHAKEQNSKFQKNDIFV
jgi:hypothetical protein